MGLDGVEIFANGSGSHHELRKGYLFRGLFPFATFLFAAGIFISQSYKDTRTLNSGEVCTQRDQFRSNQKSKGIVIDRYLPL